MLKELEAHSLLDYAEGKLKKIIPNHSYFFSVEQTHVWAAFSQFDCSTAAKLPLTIKQRRLLLEELLRYYEYYVDNFGQLNSMTVLQDVFK